MAPGTYACARCPPGYFSPAAGPTTACAPCAPLVSSPNASSCVACPALQRANGTGSCEACPLGRFCDGAGADLPCLPPIDMCLGALQGCREGHAGFLCAACAQGYFKSPSSYCAPCAYGFFEALPALLFTAVLALLFYWAFRGYLGYITPYLARLRVALSHYDVTLAVLSDQLLRLSLLRRVASLQLPSSFGWLLGFVSLVFGFSAVGSGAECVDPTWTFAKSFATVFGVCGGFIALNLARDIYACRRPGKQHISLPSWRVWDALSFCLPFAVQTSWEALTHLNVNGQERLWGEPSTPWSRFSATSIVAGCTIALQLLFVLARQLLPCTLTVVRSFDAQGREVVAAETAPPDGVHPTVNQLYCTPSARLQGVRSVLAFLRSAAIPLQMNGPLAPAAWLICLGALELALALASRGALVEELALLGRVDCASVFRPPSTGAQAAAWLFVLTVFSVTHVCVIACAASGACSSLTGLGAFLLILNALPFVVFAALIVRKSCTAIANGGANEASGGTMSPVPTASRRHMLTLDFEKPVLVDAEMPGTSSSPATSPSSINATFRAVV